MPSIVSKTYVPDEGPIDAPIVFVGEAPGNTEREEKRPFVGDSGKKLEVVMLRNGLRREDVRLANLCHYQPTGNKFKNVEGSLELAEGLIELSSYFRTRTTKPMVVVPLGANPLKYITGITKGGITSWRGSILRSNSPELANVKIIPTYHPSAVLRDGSLYPLMDFDIRRIASDSKFREFNLPEREYVVIEKNPMLLETITEEILKNATELDIDIETFGSVPACIGLSYNDKRGFCIVWSEDPHTRGCVERLLGSRIPKIFQFGTFDVNYMGELVKIPVEDYAWDTMVAQHVMFPELPRSQAFMTSIFTREPFYKFEGRVVIEDDKSWSERIPREVLWRYNIKDHSTNLVIKTEQKKLMDKGPKNWKRFFDYEMSMLPIAHAIMNNGMNLDRERHAIMSRLLDMKIDQFQSYLNTLCRRELNVASPVVIKFLYDKDKLALPERKNQEGKLTADEDAIVSLIAFCLTKVETSKKEDTKFEWQMKVGILSLILRLRGYRKMKGSYINFKISPDGRVRSTYKVAATDTGRWASEKYINDYGLNGQTFPRGDV